MTQKIYWLLLLVPITLGVRFLAPSSGILIFVLSAAAMIPLAKLLSDSTEQVAAKTGPTLGALLNVTFGNMEGNLSDIKHFDGPLRGMMGDRDVAPALKAMGFDLMNRANNHIFDSDQESMFSTIASAASR